MDSDSVDTELATLSPEDAFTILGDETRLGVLRTLGEADEPLAFSELRERVGYDTAGNFSYHLDNLTGHFIRQTDAGYVLRQPGRRVVEAVLSGAVTDAARIEPVQTDRSCPYCRAPVEVSYREERLTGRCTECAGVYGRSRRTEAETDGTAGILGHLPLPPAGIQGRTVEQVEMAAWTWGVRDMIALSNGVCPKCSARLTQTGDPCVDHETTDGLCEACGNRHAVQITSRCTNCIFEHEGGFVLKLLANTDLLAFITAHELNPVTDHWKFGWDYEEEVLSIDPFEARFTFTIGEDSLTLTVNEQLEVVESTTQ